MRVAKSELIFLRDDLAMIVMTTIRAHDVRLNHRIAVRTTDRLNGFFEVVRTTSAGASVALLSLRNSHFTSYPITIFVKLNKRAITQRIVMTPLFQFRDGSPNQLDRV